MADNRLYLRCNACNGVIRLARFTYAEGWHDVGGPIDMDELLREHKDCWYNIAQTQKCQHNHQLFGLEYEDPGDGPVCEAFPIKSWKELG